MTLVIGQYEQKIDRVEITKHGEQYKVTCYKNDIAVNWYHADNDGLATAIARRQMGRIE